MQKKSLAKIKLHGGYLFLVYALASVLGHTAGWVVEPWREGMSFLEWMEGVFFLPFSHLGALLGAAIREDSPYGWFTIAAWLSILMAGVFFVRKDWLSLIVFSVLVAFLSFGTMSLFTFTA